MHVYKIYTQSITFFALLCLHLFLFTCLLYSWNAVFLIMAITRSFIFGCVTSKLGSPSTWYKTLKSGSWRRHFRSHIKLAMSSLSGHSLQPQWTLANYCPTGQSAPCALQRLPDGWSTLAINVWLWPECRVTTRQLQTAHWSSWFLINSNSSSIFHAVFVMCSITHGQLCGQWSESTGQVCWPQSKWLYILLSTDQLSWELNETPASLGVLQGSYW